MIDTEIRAAEAMHVLTIPYHDDVIHRLIEKDQIADEYRADTDWTGPVGVDMEAYPGTEYAGHRDPSPV